MRSPEKVLSSLAEHSKSKDYKFERLYRILFNEGMYYVAYQCIYAKEGNMTKGSDGQTIDGTGESRISELIGMLKDESYQPQPSRRVYIPKKNGKKRPLGVPAFRDKLLQEVLRMILEAIYEGSFEITSHGFRPKRSCHTALKAIQTSFTGVKWFVEGDIKGFFDNIDHDVMTNILKERIVDDRFIRLIRKFLKAGYVEDWTYHDTHSGTPQGGIISPILANIYLDKLDKYMSEYKKQFDKGKERKRNPEYRKLEVQRRNVVSKLETEKNEDKRNELVKRLREIEKERNNIPYGIAQDENYRRIVYQRYADDFLIGVIGNNSDSQKVKEDIMQFLRDNLKLELSEEKTLVTHAKRPAKFLGYDIYVRESSLPKRDKAGRLVRNYGGRIVLAVTMEAIRKKLLDYNVVKMVHHNGNEVWKPKGRYYMKDNDDLEILEQYNAEIRGFYNYYSIANNSSLLNSFYYIMEYSMYKTYGTKYRTSVHNIIEKFRQGKEFAVKYRNKKGEEKVRLFYNEGFKRKKDVNYSSSCDLIPNTVAFRSSTSLMDRLKANKCELCGLDNCILEMHHMRKLKNLKGKEYWEKLMIARRRKTIAVCLDCHTKIHHGK
ncbi:maturase [Bacteroidia bacterium]|nr:maturase [Bacteroidia bacterium]